MNDNSRRERIRRMITDFAGIAVPVDTVADDHSLFDAGMTSKGSVSLMTALEVEFDMEFPDDMIIPETFVSIDSIDRALETCGAG
ncbi:acyl carrier protein [Gordonia sp. VNK1]|uniref:acyl carrier protein n=1 Tax=Gordonia oleivorans TaxID=3156618 RepID=UPI0032B42EF3